MALTIKLLLINESNVVGSIFIEFCVNNGIDETNFNRSSIRVRACRYTLLH